MSPTCSLLRRYILLCHGCRRQRILLAQRGSTKGFGCNAIRCRIHYLTRGEETSEDLCLTGEHDQCMTNRDITDQVRGNSLHRSDRIPPTGQTGPTREQVSFILQDRCTVSRRRKNTYSPLLIQRRSNPMLLCRSATSRWLSMRRAQDQWFLVNRSILLSRGLSWLMIMRPATTLQHRSTFNQGGVHQG